MTNKTNDMIDKLKETEKKIEEFSDLLDSIETSADKKKMLWKEIYENAIVDRENAHILFLDAWKQMGQGVAEHVTLGPTMAKYLERMCKSNEQILRLSEQISKSEEAAAKIDPDDLFSQIDGGKSD
tara:strand:+ start:2396 stop:2773 length:378 start_codon:yes stop_codon:yes gene_type:complete